jgi:hypothetical protein
VCLISACYVLVANFTGTIRARNAMPETPLATPFQPLQVCWHYAWSARILEDMVQVVPIRATLRQHEASSLTYRHESLRWMPW